MNYDGIDAPVGVLRLDRSGTGILHNLLAEKNHNKKSHLNILSKIKEEYNKIRIKTRPQ